MKRVRGANAAYLAGLVDADGTITLTRKHRNENRHLAVSISNTDRYLLDFVLEIVGAGKITGKRAAADENSPNYVFAIYNRQALQLLGQIQPFLRTYKWKRARLILNDYLRLTPRNGEHSSELRQARARFVAALLDIKPRYAD